MGSYYANIHLHSANRPLVEQAWQQYWADRHEPGWAWVSPPYNGWTSVYDWRSNQLETDILTDLSAHLSRTAACTALAFQVQDSELAEYWLFSAGRQMDHYTSNAEYFAAESQPPFAPPEEGVFDGYGPDSRPGYPVDEDLSDGGNIALLRSLTRAAVSDIELDAILRTPATIADDILTALASAIGINDMWASLGYHYLATESDTIPGHGEFHHLPADQPPNLRHIPDH